MPWFHINEQCPKHGECDWIVHDKSGEAATKQVSDLIGCQDADLKTRPIEPGEVAEATDLMPLESFNPEAIIAICLYS